MNRHPFSFAAPVAALSLCALVAPGASARSADSSAEPAVLRLPALDPIQLELADRRRVVVGRVAHFATPRQVDIDPWNRGQWSAIERSVTVRWTLGIVAEGATSVSLHFDRFELPEGAELVLHGGTTTRALTLEDAVVSEYGSGEDGVAELWTPPILGSRTELELRVPIASLDRVDLHIDRVHHGYAGFTAPKTVAAACRLEVACSAEGPEGGAADDDLLAQASSVGLLVIDGVRFCTGFLVTDAQHSGRPLLLTAAHCGLDARSAASVVVLWNYRRDACSAEAPAPAKQFQSGATLLVKDVQTDVALLELHRRPDPSWNVAWAGWDRSDDPLGGVLTVHHPDAAPQSVARGAAARRSRHFATTYDPAGDHLRVDAWHEGTTEGGSSGAPLFDHDGRVRGWLRGGHAACDNRLPDWFGRLADVWDDPRGPRYRLRDWLDPTGTEMIAVDGWVQREDDEAVR